MTVLHYVRVYYGRTGSFFTYLHAHIHDAHTGLRANWPTRSKNYKFGVKIHYFVRYAFTPPRPVNRVQWPFSSGYRLRTVTVVVLEHIHTVIDPPAEQPSVYTESHTNSETIRRNCCARGHRARWRDRAQKDRNERLLNLSPRPRDYLRNEHTDGYKCLGSFKCPLR